MTDYLIAHVGHTQKHDEHICWWKPDSCGYTVCVDKAGRYSEQEARSICASSDCMAVPFEPASALARSTPYYRRQDGTINKLYDGGATQASREQVRMLGATETNRSSDW